MSRISRALPAFVLLGAALAGYGIQANAGPAPHSVTLNWTASTSSVVGYNVYRATKSGGPYGKLTPTAVGATQYTDTDVKAGDTYFYVVTAVDSRKVESIKSSEIATTVPTP